MRKNIVSILIIFIGFTACQKKQYAFVQQNNIPTFDYQQRKQSNSKSDDVVKQKKVILSENKNQSNSKEILNIVASNLDNLQEKDVLKYDEEKMNVTFKELNELEKYVNSKDEISIKEIKKDEYVRAFNLDTSTTTSITKEGELPLNIPAFVWGCLLGWIGILLVYILTDDKEQTKKALYGCLVSGIVAIVVYAIIVIAAINQPY